MPSQVKYKHKYGDRRRPWSNEFVDYMYKIVKHANYKGMPSSIDNEGRIRWNAPSNRPPGKWQDLRDRRLVWWNKKAKRLNITQRGKWISRVAKTIHPFQEKPCQTCGRVMSLHYVYPTKNILRKINAILKKGNKIKYEEFLTIYEIVPYLIEKAGHKGYEILENIFPALKGVGRDEEKFIKCLSKVVIPKEPRGRLSPGSMSNAPDRLDGFHTYNLCCRYRHDTGRSVDNLRTYSDDRRAFEFWCEGDWAAANLLMTAGGEGVCPECGKKTVMTSDHVGPISLGFTHRPKFQPMCASCNSSKGNRLSFQDLQLLVEDEKKGEKVVSAHINRLWDLCKSKVKSDQDATKLSKLLRISQHYYLHLLQKIYEAGYPDVLLNYLEPEYANEKTFFEDLDRATFQYKKIKKLKRADTYSQSKACRMVRIAFDALDDYASKGKRNIHEVPKKITEPFQKKIMYKLKKLKESSFRADLLKVLKSPLGAEERSALLKEVFEGNYKPREKFTDLYHLIQSYMDAIGEYLTKSC